MNRLTIGIVTIGLALLVGTVGFPGIIMLVILYNKPLADGVMPGKLTFTVPQTETYNINQRYICIYKGRSYNVPRALPSGWTVTLWRLDDNTSVPLTHAFVISSHPSRKNSFVNIARFTAEPGTYELEVKGQGEPRPFVIAPPVSGKIIFTFLVTLGIFIGGLVLGGILVGKTVLQHLKERRIEEAAALNQQL